MSLLRISNFLRIRSNYNSFSYKFNTKEISKKLLKRDFCTVTKKNTIGNTLKMWRKQFEDKGIFDPIESIEYIVAHVIGTKKIRQLGSLKEKELTSDEMKQVVMLCKRRLEREPIQYIIGEWQFRDITLKLLPPIFMPEPQTEMLIDYVLQRVSETDFPDFCEILEVGCGSGAITLSILNACNKIKATAIDTNINACNLTLENARNLKLDNRLTVINATLQDDGKVLSEDKSLDLSKKTFDFIVSNPPYRTTKEYVTFMPEIKLHEDTRATDGGADGLRVVKPLLHYSANALKPGGRLFIEISPNNSNFIPVFTRMNANLKLKHEHTYKDLSNYDRFVELSKLR